ncbi:MAG TPA: lysophospholipid acyltransferase family protein [Dehalococcoidia bacterium]|nr:lysophospholipid acyltransferase family protein [Dehalococcoidia bacterium]
MFKYLALLISYKALNWLPTLVAYFIADVAGTVMYYLRPGLRRNVQRNMRQVMGPEAPASAIRATSRRVMRNAARYYADLVRIPRLDMERLFSERVTVVYGLNHLMDAIATKRGVVLVSAHYGNPEIVLQSSVAIGMQTFSLTEPLQPQRLCDLVHKLRGSHGQVFRPLSLSSVREAIRWLRDGKVMPLLCDRDIQNSGMLLPFFGAETRMPVGAMELALRTGAVVMPMFCRRTKGGRFDVFADPPLEMTVTGNAEEDVRANTLKVIAAIEKYVRQDPGQWIVLESIWEPRERPEKPSPVRQSRSHRV